MVDRPSDLEARPRLAARSRRDSECEWLQRLVLLNLPSGTTYVSQAILPSQQDDILYVRRGFA